MWVLGIAGSLRAGSYNGLLLGAAERLFPPGIDLRRWESLAAIPAYNEDLEQDPPEPVVTLRRTIAAADALLIATPEYNGSVPGALKNALDWASRPFPHNSLKRKPTAVIGASTGVFGAVWAQAELRKVLRTAGADMLEDELPIGQADEAFNAEGNLNDPEQRHRLTAVIHKLIHGAQASAAPVVDASARPQRRVA